MVLPLTLPARETVKIQLLCYSAPGAFEREKEIAPMSETTNESWDFFAFVPNQIEAEDNYDPLLVGFPLNILFAGITNGVQTGQQSFMDVCYAPAPETFQENSKRKEMCYFTKPKDGYFIRVIFEKTTGGWQTEKFRAKKLIQTAEGSTFGGVMIHTMMSGPEPDER
jgi:hypothetical protein